MQWYICTVWRAGNILTKTNPNIRCNTRSGTITILTTVYLIRLGYWITHCVYKSPIDTTHVLLYRIFSMEIYHQWKHQLSPMTSKPSIPSTCHLLSYLPSQIWRVRFYTYYVMSTCFSHEYFPTYSVTNNILTFIEYMRKLIDVRHLLMVNNGFKLYNAHNFNRFMR